MTTLTPTPPRAAAEVRPARLVAAEVRVRQAMQGPQVGAVRLVREEKPAMRAPPERPAQMTAPDIDKWCPTAVEAEDDDYTSVEVRGSFRGHETWNRGFPMTLSGTTWFGNCPTCPTRKISNTSSSG